MKDMSIKELIEMKIPSFGYELIREVLLPDLLGKDAPQLLYWAGKNLARKYPLPTLEEIASFFNDSGWGTLAVVEEKRTELHFELSSDMIANRISRKGGCHFQLEAGFLAEQIQQQKGLVTEAYEQQKKKDGKVTFLVKWDRGDYINEL